MKIICVLGSETKTIVKNLTNMYASLEVEYSYSTLKDMNTELKYTPIRVDKVLINEESFSKNPTEDLVELEQILDGRFFITKEIVFLLNTESRVIQYVNHMFSERTTPKITVRQQDTYNFQSITYLLGGKDALEQNEVTVERGKLVRTKIGASETITLMANQADASKGAVVFDDIEQVINMFNKIEAQKDLIDIQNIQVSTEPIIPKINGIPQQDGKPIQYLDKAGSHTKKEPLLLAVTGERGSGKTSMSYALGKSYHHDNKVLLIDLCEHNLGLSGLIEDLKENVATLFLEDLLVNNDDATTKAILAKFMDNGRQLNAITLSTHTREIIAKASSLRDVEPILSSIAEVILAKVRREYDVIIIDIPLAKYTQYSFVFNSCDYLLMTFHKSISSTISLGTFLHENGMNTDWYKSIFIPTDAYKAIDGVPQPSPSELREYIEICMNHEVVMTSPIRLSGFDLGPELANVVNSLITTLPSKLEIANYRDYLNRETAKVSKVLEGKLDFDNPFSPLDDKEVGMIEEDAHDDTIEVDDSQQIAYSVGKDIEDDEPLPMLNLDDDELFNTEDDILPIPDFSEEEI